jgi:MerR family transcriptional regulator, thiopeptide resistance regulator
MRTVGELAELARVSVRTLHHYDEIGLLSPTGRSDAGYRLYAYEDLERLREILVWRQLGFSLSEIRSLLDEPGYDRASALRRQRDLVETEIGRLGALLAALDTAVAAEERESRVEEDDMFEGFDHSEYEDEARERWGDADAYQESAKRTAAYGDDEWKQIRTEADGITGRFAELMAAGEPASGEPARVVAEQHREHITRWFYPCSAGMHRSLGDMYVADERFARNYEQRASGLAVYVRDAIAANAETPVAIAE